ncbi:MAG: hydrogenase formation protein HypD [Nitrospirota bacterium]|nr:hydrogenase formation protein HypD [Nitrospirota bacterium]MDH5769455.1 hydrogenase formation protein HypD [Nitrospirota bacterium]
MKNQDIPVKIKSLTDSIGRPLRLMEVCGTHTVAIFRHGIRDILPKNITLLSGPGCPVCVTPVKDVESAIVLSKMNNVVLTTFGDMMRVPGNKQSLNEVQAEGASIRVVYSPIDALTFATDNKEKKVVFFATGFETTSPSVAGTLFEAERAGVDNFYIYSAHKTVPPALKALLSSDDVMVDGLILPGHVSTIIGSKPYTFIALDHRVPSVITGFKAEDILQGIMMLLEQIASKRSDIEIQYKMAVKEDGNQKALALMNEYFEPCDADWRGIGTIPQSGLSLRNKYSHLDVKNIFHLDIPEYEEPKACQCGSVLRGVKIPTDCPLFGKTCTPEKPVGACMVSTEGSCAAYYKYGMHR